MSWGEQLKDAMYEWGLTQADVADTMGIGQGHLSQLLGRTNMSERTALRIAQAMGAALRLEIAR